ncbi:uncharacterized protein LOC124265207 [Haliotis rubra]|uniref:uncharacterized protein LOC124265207 n=1 Tax=Haliotis rubra TaxID=36100 RepID=UPI001EE53B5D|nr:uncharacterized protein LOC124265207 [Haliotis rubra]
MKYSARKKVQSQPVQSWTLAPPRQSWAHTHASSSSGNQHQMQHVSQSYPTKTGNNTQYLDMGRGQGQQSTFVSSTFSEPPTYTETAPAPADYTLPAGSVTTPPPVPVMPSSTTGVVSTSLTGT